MDHAHDLTLYLAAGAILAAPFGAWASERSRRWMVLAREPVVAVAVAIRHSVILLSLGAGAIHFAVTNDHYAEGLLAGLLMSAVAWFQLLWPVSVAGNPRRHFDLSAIAVNAGTILAWLASRTVGLRPPIGDGRVELVGALDVLATSFELGIVLGLTALLVGNGRLATRAVTTRSATLAVGVLALLVLVLTTAAIGGQPAHHH